MLNLEAVTSLATVVRIYRATKSHIADEIYLHIYRHGNPKDHEEMWFLFPFINILTDTICCIQNLQCFHLK